MPDPDPLIELSEAVADGAAIDWAQYRARATGEPSTVEYLRVIAAIAAVQRTTDTTSDSTSAASPPAPAVPIQGRRWGPLVIEDTIAAGGFGRVYRARDPRLGRVVALKVLSRHADHATDDGLVAEARLLALVRHPNVVTVYGADIVDGEVGLWMELVEGQTLAAWVRAHGALGAEEAAMIGATLCRALASVHQAGLLHRDIKAQNVMREPGGRIVLMDFGAVRDLLEPATARSAVGTPIYLAPEVLAGHPATERSDLYCLGVLLFFLTTQRYPITAATIDELRARHLEARPAQLRDLRPDLPTAFVEVVNRALSPDRAQRFESAGHFEQALLKTVAGDTAATTRQPQETSGSTRSRSWSRIAAGATVAAVATALIAALTLWRNAQAPVVAAPHLVALPCQSSDASADAICSGLSESLIIRLARLTATHQLQVTPQLGGLFGAVVTVPDARRSLGATRVLQGQPDAAGAIRFALAGGDERSPIETLPLTPGDDLFEAEERAVAWLVRLLDLNLTHAERESLIALATKDAAARRAFLAGRGYLAGGKDVEAAITSFTTALAADPHYGDAHVGLGMAWRARYLRDRDPASAQRARAACEQSVSLQPNHSAGRTCLGMLHHADQQFEAAAAELARAVEADPTYDDGIVWLGRTQEELHHFDDAERSYQRAVERRPASYLTHTWLANFYRRQARYEDAARALGKAVELVPGHVRLRAALATPLVYLGRYDEAIALLKAAIEVEPTREAYVTWGMTLYRMHRFEEAVSTIDRARALGTDVAVLAAAARAHYWWGTPDARAKADALYREALTLVERDLARPAGRLPSADPHLQAAEFLAKLNRPDEARAHLQKAGVNPDDRPSEPHQLFYGAIVFAQIGDRETAIKWLDRAQYWGVPTAELRAWIDLDSLRSDSAFQRLIRPN